MEAFLMYFFLAGGLRLSLPKMKSKILFILSLLPCFLFSQASKFQGNWVSAIEVNQIPLDIRFQVLPKYDSYISYLDVPGQNLKHFKMSSTEIKQNKMTVESSDLNLILTATRSDSNTMKGVMVQNGKTTHLIFKKSWGLWPIPKPQTPKAPFSYVNQEVKIPTADGRIMAAGTLSLPDTFHKYPTVIFISGSGAQDRDGSIGNHHPFAVLADAFVKQGFGVLRCDDRGAGKTIGSPTVMAATTSKDIAEDVSEFIHFLKSQPNVDSNKIGLLGHSEGGIVAPMVASQYNTEVAFLILLAAPAFGGVEINSFQNEVALKSSKMKSKDLKSYMVLHRKLLNGIIQNQDTTAFKPVFDSILINWRKNDATSTLRKQMANNKKNNAILFKRYSSFYSPWWKFFLAYDPKMDLAKVHCPVLALNGSKDNQVPSNLNLDILKTTIESNGNKNVKALEMKDMNHLFQTCKTCDFKGYFTLEESFSPEALKEIQNWLKTIQLN